MGGGYFLRNTNKRKGFTLIELLAVIVILSVIAVIATPIILNIVNDARKSAVKDSTYGYIEAIENEVALSYLEDEEYKDNEEYGYDEIKVDVKGIIPTGGLYTLKDGIVTNGTFCIDGYTVNYENNEVEVGNKGCNEEDLKLNGSIKLSSNSGNYTYPETKEIEVIENISRGTLSCETSDSSVATCSIKDNIITVKSGTKEGSATLTIKSSSTSKYKEASAAYVAITAHGLLSVTANGYTGIYDSNSHGITVKVENAIIKYGTEKDEEGNVKYELEESPKYTDVGEYTVYYEITKAGYKTVTGSKNVVITKAEGKIELEENEGTVAYKETKEVEIIKNISNGEIEVEIANPELVEVNVENNKIVIKGKQIGTTTLTVTSKETHNYNSKSTQYNIEVIKANNTLKLSSTSGSYTYPSSGTIEVIENISGGTLSCETSNTKVATCSISGNIITVKPGTTEGSATLTIKSKETANYNEAQVAYVAITSKGTLTSYTANGYTGIYDSKEHGITVTSENSTITYSTDGTNYSSENPKYTDVGEYKVYYKIEKEGYNDITGSKNVVITKAEGKVIAPTAKTLTYNGNSQTLINAGSTTTGTIEYKIGNGTYSEEIPSATNAGTYTVYYKVVGDKNHNDVKEGSISVTINKATLNYTSGGYSGAYDGSSHGITVISEGAIIKYGEEEGTYNLDASPTLTDVGTKTVYFKITRDNYVDVTGSEKIEITKANNTLKLSSTSGNYTYPDSGTFEVIENTSNGTLTCETNNSKVATCTISGNIITVVPGKIEGNATLTIKSGATKNYNGTQVAYVAITAKGTLTSYTANGYKGIYDENSHGIMVTSENSTITYSIDGINYSSENPKYTDVGEYTVYYKIEKEGYNDITGSKNVVITKANGSVTAPTAKTLKYNGNSQTLINAGSSTTGIIYYKLGSGSYSTSLPSATDAGTYTVYYKVVGDENHKDVGESSINITIGKANGSVTAPTAKTLYYTGSNQTLINAGSSSTGTIQYKLGSTGTYSTSLPTASAVGTYTVYYKVVGDSNHKDVAESSISVIIDKANNTLTLSENTKTYTYPTSGTFTVKENKSGGTLSCETSNSAVATCTISGTTVTVTPGTTKGTATLTIKSAETTNYNAGQVAHVATTEEGLLSYTASDYNKAYDGEAHGITVTASGATIKYGTSSGSYTETTSPTLTNVGTKTVYYQITKAGYKTVTGSKTITITKASGKVTAPTAKTLTYTGLSQTLINAGSSSTGTIQYKLGSGSYSTSLPSATEAGTYTVYYKVVGDSNHNDVAEASISVTIGKKNDTISLTSKTYTYDGSGKTATISSSSGLSTSVTYYSNSTCTTSLSGNPVNAGTYYAKVTTAGNNNWNSSSLSCTKAVTINKANNTLTLSENTKTYTYPTSGTFTVTENKSGGTLSCETSNSAVATCTISGTTVTVTPGTTKGTATLTIKSAETTNYNAGQVAHVATTEEGLLSYTASDYNKAYDGEAHGITVTASGATIKYGTSSGSYTETTSPTLTNVGTKTVYYQITKAGYKTVTGSKTITITKAAGKVTAPTAKTLTYTGSSQTLINAGSSSTGTIQYKLESGSYSTNLPSATDKGTYTVYYKVVGDENHNDVAEASIIVTIEKKNDTISLTAKTYTYDGSGKTATFTTLSGLTPSVTYYKDSSCTTAVTGNPVNVNVNSSGQVIAYYAKATTAGNNNWNSASLGCTKAVTINKVNNTLTLSANTATYTYPTSGTFTVTKNTSGGSLSCSTSNSAVATCSISGTTVTVKPGTTEGTANITVTSGETTNYNAATVTHVATTASGTLSVTANGYDGSYDGAAHGITVTASGATIKYGTSSGTYNLTSSPTYTNVGTYTVYYQVTKAGYKTVTGSKQVIIKDNTKPSISFKSTMPTIITKGDSYTISNYLNVSYGPTGGSYSCVNNSNTITNLSSLSIGNNTITCTATGKNGLTNNTSLNILVFNPDYMSSKAGDLIWTYKNGDNYREYYKVNAGLTLYSYATFTGNNENWTAPLLVSTIEDAVTYETKGNYVVTRVYSNTMDYLGHKWYISSTGAWYEGDFTSNAGTARKIYVSGSGDIEGMKKAAKEFIDLALTENKYFTYNYTGNEQVFIAPYDGKYKIELWGAQGSTPENLNISSINNGGAYTSGEIYLNKSEKLYIYVGEEGTEKNGTPTTSEMYGFNGGAASNFQCYIQYGEGGYNPTGGGATDVRLINGSWDSSNGLKSRIMVAAGGAGYDGYQGDVTIAGAGGGLIGYPGLGIETKYVGTGGTQTFGGDASGEFGKGGLTSNYGKDCNLDGAAGAGSGYYGGGASKTIGTNTYADGGGGSSFISGHSGCDAINESGIHTNQSKHYSGKYFINTKMIDGIGYNWTSKKEDYTGMPTYDGKNTMKGNSGNGYAKITFLGNN